MATIQLHSDCPNTNTMVSNIFIDQYMPKANGEFVKVYLYLLRCMNTSTPEISISKIADLLEHTEKDVIRALKYWEKENLLHISYNADQTIDSLCITTPGTTTPGITSINNTISTGTNSTSLESSNPIPSSKENTVSPEKSNQPAKKEYTLDEIKEFQQSEDISELFFIIETYLKRQLGTTDINTVLYWYESLHFSTELIVYLVEYCISKGHSSIRYMDKVALGWADQNISTVNQAKDNSAAHSQYYYGVMKALGISGRNLVDSETAYIAKWSKEYGFDLEMIQEACKRTITATHQSSFEYTDSILSNWHTNQAHTLKDIARLDATYNRNKKAAETRNNTTASKNKFNNFNQRDYDYDQLEKVLLTTTVN